MKREDHEWPDIIKCPNVLTKIGQFELSFLIDEEVLRLQVPVEDFPLVTIRQPTQNLEQEDLRKRSLTCKPNTKVPSQCLYAAVSSWPHNCRWDGNIKDRPHLHIVHAHNVSTVVHVLLQILILQGDMAHRSEHNGLWILFTQFLLTQLC